MICPKCNNQTYPDTEDFERPITVWHCMICGYIDRPYKPLELSKEVPHLRHFHGNKYVTEKAYWKDE